MRQDIILKTILTFILFFCLLEFQNGVFGGEMEGFKQEKLAVKGEIINIHSALLGKEQRSFLLIAVRVDTLIRKEGEEKLAQATIWVLRIPEEKRELFQGLKPGDNIIAYGIRKGEARVLDVIGKGLEELAK